VSILQRRQLSQFNLSAAHGLVCIQCRSPVSLEFFGRLSAWSGSWA